MPGIFDELTNVLSTVASTAAPAAMTAAGVSPPSPAGPTEDRLAALEQFALTWGPIVAKIAPLIEAL